METSFAAAAASSAAAEVPEKGASAILELARWVNELYKLNDFAAGTTVNVGLFDGGDGQHTVLYEHLSGDFVPALFPLRRFRFFRSGSSGRDFPFFLRGTGVVVQFRFVHTQSEAV